MTKKQQRGDDGVKIPEEYNPNVRERPADRDKQPRDDKQPDTPPAPSRDKNKHSRTW
jgi:hypothetical protein